MKYIFATLLLFTLTSYSPMHAQTDTRSVEALKWATIKYEQMSLKERIGQLFMVAAYSGGKNYNESDVTDLINNYHIGGLIFMQGSISDQIKQTNKYQTISRTPLLIAMDAEWGIGMRLTEVTDLAKNIQIGATRNAQLAFQVGQVIGAQCKRLGVHVDFGPVVDVNNNPDNPVINFRSFGEDKEVVSTLGVAYSNGLQNMNVMACAKHFPGHGDTDVDSHKDLPQISKSYQTLWDNELYPFRECVQANVPSMMIAHLMVPALTNSNSLPTTLSYNCITGLLKGKMKYKGLIFTDALNMQGVAKYYQPGEVDYKAFMAGNDVLLFSQSVPKAIRMIEKSVESGAISQERLKESVVKILAAKFYYGAKSGSSLSAANAAADLNAKTDALNRAIAAKSITLVRDDNKVMHKGSKASRVAYVSLGTMRISSSYIKNRGLEYVNLPENMSNSQIDEYLRKWSGYNKVIIGIHGVNKYPNNNYGLSSNLRRTANYFASHGKNVCLLINGNPYAIKYFCDAPSIMVNYEETDYNMEASLDIILGKAGTYGVLPITPCSSLKAGTGITATLPELDNKMPIPSNDELIESAVFADAMTESPYAGSPETELSKYNFSGLDNIVQSSIQKGVFPGCQVLVAKDGRVVYYKSFGKHQYENSASVQNTHVYDIASVTKIAATTLAVMKLYEEGKIDLDKYLGDYLTWTRNTSKQYLTIRRILLHEAGLTSWIPFYKETLDENGNYIPGILSTVKSPVYSIPVASNLWINRNYPNEMWDEILKSDVGSHRYLYSDLDFMFLQKVVEQVSGMPLDQYVSTNFYMPLHLTHIGFNPKEKRWVNPAFIVPTERDDYFRKQLVDGYVHDPGAAMLGGVAGHAGLFSNAADLFVVMQMLANGGEFSGRRYLKASTVSTFTKYNSSISRRGLGFDKPENHRKSSSPAGERCSPSTFGHQGFTGTCTWADPSKGVVFVFLSNRVYPTAENKLISRLDVRTRLQDEAYRAMGL